MSDQRGSDPKGSERIEVGGIAGGLSLAALRSLLDPATREAATIDIDLSRLRLTVPAAVLHELVARAAPGGSISLREDGVTVRPGGGSPGLDIGIPVGGVRVRIETAGLTVDTD